MNTLNKTSQVKKEATRVKIVVAPFYFEEDPQLTPGRCWERRQQSLDLNYI